MDRKIKICFLGLELAPVFFSENYKSYKIAGSQIQLINIGNILKNDFEIHYIVENIYNNHKPQKVDDFIIHPSYNPNIGKKKIRFIYRIRKIWHTLKKVDADIYYQRVPSLWTGILAFFCKMNKKKFIYAVANDNEFTRKWNLFNYKIEESLFRYGLKRTDTIIAQNRFQYEQLKIKGYKTVIIKSVYCDKLKDKSSDLSEYILSVGMITPKKQYEYIIDIANSNQKYQFIIIGIGKGLYYNKIKNKINNSNNIILLDNMSRSEIINKYYKASLLLHAAKAEGFPNVFLESFAQGVPVVSIKLDPDNVINNNQLGFVVNNKVECKEIINKITGSNSLRKKMGENAINYIKSNHLPEIIKVEYLKLFKYV